MAGGAVPVTRNWANPMDNPYGMSDQSAGQSTQGPSPYTPPPDSTSYTPQQVGTPSQSGSVSPATPLAPFASSSVGGGTASSGGGGIVPSTPQAPSLAALSAGSGAPPEPTPAPQSSGPLLMESAPQNNVGMRMPPSLATLLKASIY